MKFKKILGIIMTGIMLSANMPINAFADEASAVDAVLSEDSVTSESAVTVSDNNIRLDFSVISQWNGGFNGEITINNLSDKVIENWQIEMEFPHEITNIWNAVVVSNENTVYNIKNAGGNNAVNIPIGGSVTFGFTGTYEDEIISPQNIRLVTGKADADNESYCVDYTLLSDWGSGYSAQITITNNSDTPMEAWDLEFEFDREIETIWNAVIKEHVGNKYYITNAAYNSIIPAKSSICFGFNGSKGESSDEPENYKLIHSGNVIYTDIDEKEEIDYEKDTDGDKLPDWFEEIIGSSIDKIDSDDDGLTDYDEIVFTGTDPIKYDTDENGVCDADEDTDSDNIVNSSEMELGTNPSNADTDSDGLNDYDELYIYHTDPLKYDTDDDGLSDGDEILFGLSPDKQDTDNDGVKDCDEKIKQTIAEEICCDELQGITNIAVTIEISGNIKDSVDIENMYNKNVLSSDLVGIESAPMDITCSQDFDTAEIVFTYDEDKLDTAPENLGILWYNEDEQFYEVMDTTLDKDNHCISMTTPHFSEYTVVDLTKWFKAWEQKIDYQTASIAKKNASWNGKVVTAQQLCDEYNNFFGYEDVVQLNNVLGACEQGDIYAKTAIVQVKLKNGVVLYYPCIFMALSEFNGITLSITDYNAAPSPDCGGWSVAYVDYDQAEYQFEHFEDYGNIWPKYEDISYIGRQFYNNYFVPAGQVDTTDDDNDGLYDIYELTGMRIANGQVIYTKTNTDAAEEENETLGYDTDGDGLSDGEEIIRQDTERGYFVLKSDPNSDDSDNDGLYDDEDPEPLEPFDDRFMLVDDFNYVPSIEFVDRHLYKGQECYLSKMVTELDKTTWYALYNMSTLASVTPSMQLFLQAVSGDNLGIEDYSNISAISFSKMLGWYITGTGLCYNLNNNDMAGIIYSQQNNYEHMVYNIQQFKNAAEEIVVNDNEKYITTSGSNDFKVSCYKAINCITHMSHTGYDDSYAASWGYAIGETLGGMTGKVSMQNGIYHATIKYYLIDTYEFPVHWNIDLRKDILNVLTHNLHECGLAKEYKIIGEYTVNISWEKGNQEADYRIIRVSGDYTDEIYSSEGGYDW